MKKVFYKGDLYTVEEIQDHFIECDNHWYRLTGEGWVKKSECQPYLIGLISKNKSVSLIIGLVIVYVLLSIF